MNQPERGELKGWVNRVEAKLARLQSEANVEWVALAQGDGSVAAASPGADGLDLPSLAALAAGSFSASEELMRLAGETSPPRHMVHKGERQSLVVTSVAGDQILLMGFNSRKRVGLVRALAERTATELAAMGEPPPPFRATTLSAGAELETAVSDALDELLGSEGSSG